jgi:hypothetical protein
MHAHEQPILSANGRGEDDGQMWDCHPHLATLMRQSTIDQPRPTVGLRQPASTAPAIDRLVKVRPKPP